MTVITEPGFYNLAAADYHADPIEGGSLSQSRAKLLLQEGGPAKFHADIREHRTAFDEGTAAHAYVLGKGEEQLVLIDADDYRSVKSRDARDEARAAGKTPLLRSQDAMARAMADALANHPTAVDVLTGNKAVAAFAKHPLGIWLRGMFDTLGETHIGDYKTTADASSEGVTRAVWRYKYHLQAAWYAHLHKAITGRELPFRFVFQEKKAPYLVSVWEATPDYIELGQADMDDALQLYVRCRQSDIWPGYPSEIQQLTPPEWAYDDDIEIDTED